MTTALRCAEALAIVRQFHFTESKGVFHDCRNEINV